MSTSTAVLDEHATAKIINIAQAFTNDRIAADIAIRAVVRAVRECLGPEVLVDPFVDKTGFTLDHGDIVRVPHPEGAFLGQVVVCRVSDDTMDPVVVVHAPGYIGGDGRLGFRPDTLEWVRDGEL